MFHRITIKVPTGEYRDSKPVMAMTSARAREIDFSQSDRNFFGSIQNSKIFLFPPPADGIVPIVGAEIECNGKKYDIIAVRVCRGISARVSAYRCAVA